jgi:antitoxin VapB
LGQFYLKGDVVGLNIKNDEVYRLAREVAKRTGSTMTDAIRVALEEKLGQLERAANRDAVLRRVDEIIRRSGPTAPGVSSDHDDLYDEMGLPA